VKLSEVEKPCKLRIVKIHEHFAKHKSENSLLKNCGECALVKRLYDLGFLKGEKIELIQMVSHCTFAVKVKGATYAICKTVASHIEVEECED